jgi:hypothetical protein
MEQTWSMLPEINQRSDKWNQLKNHTDIRQIGVHQVLSIYFGPVRSGHITLQSLEGLVLKRF